MQRLWAPWRMEYIEGSTPESPGCIFCNHPDQTERWDELLVLAVAPRAFVMLNRYPYTNAHLLVAPRVHVGALTRLDDADLVALTRLVKQATAVLEAELRPDGFNIGVNQGRAAGAGIPDHVHFHIVPRWDGDNNYVAVLAETRVMHEHLQRTYARLVGPMQSALGEAP